MINKDSAIKSILADLKKGISKKDIMRDIAQKCTKDGSTLRRWFTEANEQYKAFMNVAAPIIQEKEIEAMGELAKAGILSKMERQKILTQIALGTLPLTKYIVADGVIQERDVVPNYADRRAAIQELNKMDGAYVSDIDPDEDITEVVIRRIT